MKQDHSRLRECAARLEALLNECWPPDMAVLARVRWALGSQIMQHVTFEDRYIYAKLGSHSNPDIARSASALQAEVQALFLNYVEHAKAWTPERIRAEWDAYRTDTRALLDSLIFRMLKEEDQLYPLLGLAKDEASAHPPQDEGRSNIG